MSVRPIVSTEMGQLRRRLNLFLLVFYGTGITVGAGIYVLIAPVAGYAGIHTPLAFVFAAVVMALTVASYAELCTRFPVAAGEAAYVKAAFRSRPLSIITGLLMVIVGVVASAAVTLGSVGYISALVPLPRELLIIAVILFVSAVASWGILESVMLTSLFTFIEVGALVAIIAAAVESGVPFSNALLAVPPIEAAAISGIFLASLLAFFAFIGFEDLTNLVEEAHAPTRNVPLAMILTLLITTVLYVLIGAISVTAVPIDRLVHSEAPLALIFQEVAGFGAPVITAVAIGATLNTVIAQMTMASRVVYGMARQKDLPPILGEVSVATGTPLFATAAVSLAVLAFTFFLPLVSLAEFTSMGTLVVFGLVNFSLLRLKMTQPRHDGVVVPIWVPALGLLSAIVMIGGSLF